jgi:hypothetical protein
VSHRVQTTADLLAGLLLGPKRELEDRVAEHEPYFIGNPGYHDGARASFVWMSKAYDTYILRNLGVNASELVASPARRTLTILDVGFVITVAAKKFGGRRPGMSLKNILMASPEVVIGEDIKRMKALMVESGWALSREEMESVEEQVVTKLRAGGIEASVSWHQAVATPPMTAQGGSS